MTATSSRTKRVDMQVAESLDNHASMVSNVIVWGNPASTSALDVLHGTTQGVGGSVPLQNVVDEELVQIMSQAVRERTGAIVQVSYICTLDLSGGGPWQHVHGHE